MQEITKGKLLVAEPTLLFNAAFSKAVVFLTEHNQEGSVGFILNKPLEFTVSDLLPEIYSELTVFNGGPVEQENLYFIHTVPNKIENSFEIANGVYWGGDFETVKQLLNTNNLSKNEIRFFLGYSGWSAGQLEEEINDKSWLVFNNDCENKLFQVQADKFWQQKIKELGGNYLYFLNSPENPILN